MHANHQKESKNLEKSKGSEKFCTLCFQVFQIPEKLYEHLQNHHENNHKCGYCDKSFETSDSLHSHVLGDHKDASNSQFLPIAQNGSNPSKVEKSGSNDSLKEVVEVDPIQSTTNSKTRGRPKSVKPTLKLKPIAQPEPKNSSIQIKKIPIDKTSAHQKVTQKKITNENNNLESNPNILTHVQALREFTKNIEYELEHAIPRNFELIPDESDNDEDNLEDPIAKVFVEEIDAEVDAELGLVKAKQSNQSKARKNLSQSKTKKLDKLKCEKCGQGFENRLKLKKHISSEHKQNVENMQQVTLVNTKVEKEPRFTETNNSNKFDCQKCGVNFPTNWKLKKHIIKDHEEKSYKCNSCDKIFDTENELEKHKVSQHSDNGMLSYSCDFCLKTFTEKQHLDQHIQEFHHDFANDKAGNGSMVFTCTYCDRGYISLQILKSHINDYHRTNINKCGYCEKDFKDKKNLEDHLSK